MRQCGHAPAGIEEVRDPDILIGTVGGDDLHQPSVIVACDGAQATVLLDELADRAHPLHRRLPSCTVAFVAETRGRKEVWTLVTQVLEEDI